MQTKIRIFNKNKLKNVLKKIYHPVHSIKSCTIKTSKHPKLTCLVVVLILFAGFISCNKKIFLTEQTDYNEEISKLKKLIKKNHDSSYLNNELGWVYLFQGKGLSNSIMAFERALELQPSNSKANEGLAYIELLRGNFSKSIENLIKAINFRNNPYEIIPLLNLCYAFSHLEGSKGSVKKLCYELLERNDINPFLESDIKWILSNLLLRDGDIDAAKKIRSSLGFIVDWSIIGPFGNENNEGYDAAYPPEHMIDYNKFYKVGNRDLNWLEPEVKTELGYVQLDSLIYPYKQSTSYTLVYINSKNNIDAFIRFGTGAKFKLWLNDNSISECNQFRKISFDMDNIPIKLKEGWNKVLIKFCNDSYPLGFYFRLTDLVGSAIKDLQVSTRLKNETYYIKDETPMSFPNAHVDIINYFNDMIINDPDYLFHHLYLGLYYMFRNPEPSKNDKDTYEFIKCSEIAPDSPLFYYFIGITDTDFTTIADSLEKARKLDKETSHCTVMLAKEFFYNGFFKKSRKYLLEAIYQNPKSPLAHYYLGLNLFSIGYQIEGIQSIKKVMELAPFFSYPYYVNATNGKDFIPLDERITLMEKSLELDFLNNNAREKLANYFTIKDNINIAERLIKEKLLINPFDYNAYIDLTEIFAVREDYESAIFYCNKARDLSPENPEILAKLGDLYFEKNNTSKAEYYWQKSFKLSPNKQINKKLSKVKDDYSDFYYNFRIEFDKIKKLIIPESWIEKSSIVVLLNQNVKKINTDFSTWTYHHKVIKICKENTLYPMVYIPFILGEENIKILSAKIISEDGTRIYNIKPKEERIFRGKYHGLTYSNYMYKILDFLFIEKNIFIDFEYLKIEKFPKLYIKKFSELYNFSNNENTIVSKYTLMAPKNINLEFKLYNFIDSNAYEKSIDHEYQIHNWTLNNIEKIKIEPHMPHFNQFLPYLSISNFKSWDEISNWYDNLSKDIVKPSDTIRNKALEITKNAKDDLEKISLIHDFVARKIDYLSLNLGKFKFTPYDPKDTLKYGFGDCKDKSVLFVSMLKSIDVNANIALTSLKSYGYSNKSIPNPLIFDHVISYLPDQSIWIDVTSNLSGIHEIPFPLQNMPVLLIGNKVNSITEIPIVSPEKNLVASKTEINIDENGRISGNRTIQVYGSSASITRYLYKSNLGLEKILEKLTKNFKNVKVSNLNKNNINKLKLPVTIGYEFSFSVRQNSYSGEMIIPTSLFPKDFKKRFASEEIRSYPLDLRSTMFYDDTVIIYFPRKYKIENLPENFIFEEENFILKKNYNLTNNYIKLKELIRVENTYILPEQYTAFKNFCHLLDKSEHDEITLIPEVFR